MIISLYLTDLLLLCSSCSCHFFPALFSRLTCRLPHFPISSPSNLHIAPDEIGEERKRVGTVGLSPGGPFQVGDFSFTQISLNLDLKDPRRPEDSIAIARSPGSGGTTQEPGSLSGDSGCIWSLEVPVRRDEEFEGVWEV